MSKTFRPTVVAACSAVVACLGHGGTDNYLQHCGLDEAKAAFRAAWQRLLSPKKAEEICSA